MIYAVASTVVLGIGGGNIRQSGDLGSAVNGINEVLFDVGTYAGAILIALAVIKIILSMQDQNPNAKAQASIMLGMGIIAISFSAIMKGFNITANTSAAQVAQGALDIIGKAMTFIGVMLVALSIYQFIMSFLNEQSEEKVAASRLLGTGIAFMAGSAIVTQIAGIVINNKGTNTNVIANTLVRAIFTIIGNTASYIGAGLFIYGIFHLITAFRNEEIESKMRAGVTIGVAIALMGFNGIIKIIFF